MGLLDFGANVVVRMKYETAEAKAALKDLTGAERKAAEERLKALEASNKQIEKQSKNWQFAAQAVGAVTAAYAVGKSGLDAYAKTSEVAAAQVKKFKDAGTKAMDSLMSSIGKAVVQLEPLISGIATLVTKLSEVGVAGPAAIGALALAVTGNPVIAGIIGGTAWAASGDYGSGDLIGPDGSISIGRGMKNVLQKKRAAYYGQTGKTYGVDDFSNSLSKLPDLIGNGIVFGLGKAGITSWSPFETKKSGSGSSEDFRLDPDNLRTYGSRYRLGTRSGSTGVAASTGGGAGIDRIIAEQRRAFDIGSRGLMSPYAAQGAGIAAAQESQLAQVFGPLSDFNAYQSAFEGLAGAVGSALGAWIDGSMSAGKAFKAFIGEAVKSIAIQMAMEALKHGAFAIGSLAFGNIAGASLHGQAAAQFAVGAAVASVAAKQLVGGGGGASASTGGGYRPVAPNTGGAPSGQNPYNAPTIIVGDPYAYDSPRNQMRIAKRLTTMALGTSAVSYG